MKRSPSSGTDPYAQIASLYDLEHDDYVDDLELFEAIAGFEVGPVLEMGCGSGRVAVALAQQGLSVEGLDLSDTMIDRMIDRARSAGVVVPVHRIGMENVGHLAEGSYGMVLYSLNGLCHLTDQSSQQASLQGAYAVLKPGGTLLLDLPNPTPEYLLELSGRRVLEWSSVGPDARTIDKWTWRTIDPVNQLIDTVIWYDQLDAEGVVQTLRTSFSLRYLHLGELGLLLGQCGFVQMATFGSYHLDPLDSQSDRMIVTAIRPPC